MPKFQPVVYLPPEKLDQCSACHATSNLRMCSKCGESTYCSKECQRAHWPLHKLECGETDKIDLYRIYPFFATLMDASHIHPEKPMHMGLIQQIVNSPNPHAPLTTLCDGSKANIIILGNELRPGYDLETWWPTAESPEVRERLFRRIVRDGCLLANVTVVCMSILAKIYTTNGTRGNDSAGKRVRLRYRSHPIADFGIARGKLVGISDRDRLVYFDSLEPTVATEQTTEQHYWIYFTTVRGDEIILDCGLYPFNNGIVIQSSKYAVNGLPHMNYAPAYLFERTLQRSAPTMHSTHQRFSVLQNTDLHEAIKNSGGRKGSFEHDDCQIIWSFMNRVAGKPCTYMERYLAMQWIVQNCNAVDDVVQRQIWKTWPELAEFGIDCDPGEEPPEPTEEENRTMGHVRRLNRRLNRGELSRDKWMKAIHAWKARSRADHN